MLARDRVHRERGRQEAPDSGSDSVGDLAKVGIRRPHGQVWWHRHRGWHRTASPLTDDIGARRHVTEPFASGAEDGTHDGRYAAEQVELQDPDHAPREGMTEGNRPSVVAHDPQPGGELADRPPARERLHRHGIPHHDEDHRDEHDGARHGIVEAAGEDAAERDDNAASDLEHHEVDYARQNP